MAYKPLQGITYSRIVIFLLSCTLIFPSIFSGIFYPVQHHSGAVVGGGGNMWKAHQARGRAPLVIFEDDMEAGGDAANGLWEVTELVDEDACEPWAIVISKSHSATHSWWIDDKDKRTAEVLDTPVINVPQRVADPELRFWHYVDTESSYDGGWLQYRKDEGAWTDVQKEIITKNAYNDRIGYQGSGIPSGVEKPAWSGKPYGAFSEVVVDLSGLDLAGHSLRIRWRFESDGGVAGNGWWIDDVKVTVEPLLTIDKGSIGCSASSLYRYNGTTNISCAFSDFPGYEPDDYELSMAVRGSDLEYMRLLDNQTHGNLSLNIVKLSPGNFTFSFILVPSGEFSFGRYNLSLIIRNVNGWEDSVSFDENDANFMLLSVPPFFRNETVNFPGGSINVLDHRGIPLSIVFHDPDAQDPDDFSMGLYLEGPNAKISVFENLTNHSGLDISMDPDGLYNVSYLWYPDNPEEMMEGTYEIELILREGDEYEITLGMFDIEQNVAVMKRYLPDILSFSCTPDTVNVSGSASTEFRGSFLDPDTLYPGDFQLTIRIRDKHGRIIVIANNRTNGENGISIVKEGAARWMLRCLYNPPDDLPLGSYDLYLGVFDGESPLVSMGFDNNTDGLFLYRNTNPVIEEVECSVTRVNIFGEDSCRFSAVFSDTDHESMGNFSAHLTLLDPEGNVHALVGGPGEDANASALYLSPLDGSKFVFRYDIDPPSHFTEGEYLISFSIRDGWQGLDILTYTEIGINLTFFYNSFPSPPMKIWPNSTTDTFPLISWWGALDEETPHDELKYWIQMGTSPGDDSILAWYNTNFSTYYRPARELATGVFYVQVRCFDGEYYSDALEIVMTVTRTGNSPPGIPGLISPLHTIRQDPAITWGASTDEDANDLIEYFISIGTSWHSGDIITNIPTSINTFYQLPFKLDYGTYYVQVSASDGHEFSPVREQKIIIFDPFDNISPIPPTSLEPRMTTNPLPLVSWSGSIDYNDDKLFFWLQIGTSSGNGDVLPWLNTGENRYFQLDESLTVGRYYFQVKCFDGSLFSDVFETTVDILNPRPPLPPTSFDPSFTTDPTPLLNWSGASYPDGDNTAYTDEGNFSYLIQLGTNETTGDVLPWTLVENQTFYQVENELWFRKPIFVQIKAFDGILYSNVSVWTLVVTEFRLTIGFNVTNYIYNLEESDGQILAAFIMNHGAGELTLTLSVAGSLSAYVEIAERTVKIGGGEMLSISLVVNVPPSMSVGENSQIVLTATSQDGAMVSSLPISFKRVVVTDEEWYASLEENSYFILGIAIICFTLILLLVLILKRFKRGKRERSGVTKAIPDTTDLEMEEYLSSDQYSTSRAAPRRSLKSVEQAILQTLRAHGMMSSKKRIKVSFQPRRVPLSLTGGGGSSKGEQPRALPPPPPGDVSSSEALSDHDDPLPATVDTSAQFDEAVTEGLGQRLPGPPEDTMAFPGSDTPDAGSPLNGPPATPEMEYISPESGEITHEDPTSYPMLDLTDADFIEGESAPRADVDEQGFFSREIGSEGSDEYPSNEIVADDGREPEDEVGAKGGSEMEAVVNVEVEGEVEAGMESDAEGEVKVGMESDAEGEVKVGMESDAEGEVEARMDNNTKGEAELGIEDSMDDRVKGEIKSDMEGAGEDEAEESSSALNDIMGILGIEDDEEL